MSLFVGNLAFADNLQYMDGVRLEFYCHYYPLYLATFNTTTPNR